MMRRLVRLADFLSFIAAALAVATLIGLVALVIAEIISRSVFNSSILFAIEWASYLQGALIFLGAGYTLRTGGHIRVALSFDLLPTKARRVIDLTATGVAIVIAGILAYAMADLAIDAFFDQTTSAWPSQTPLFVPQLAIAIGAFVLFTQLLGRLLALAAGLDVVETTNLSSTE